MSHNTGTVQAVSPPFAVGPVSGPTSGTTWSHTFTPAPAPSGTKFVMLHFRNAALPGANRLEVDLGYGVDIFDAASGPDFWTRPINVAALGGGIPIRYVGAGSPTGGAEIHEYGRGERLPGEQDPTSLSNSDPFLVANSYTEPIYDPTWFCNRPPIWENVECVPIGDVRRQVARSVGMIVTVHGTGVSTCSVTAIGPDTVLTAGHCLEHIDHEWPTSSVTFDYQTDCAGNAPPGYNPIFHKVTGYLKFRWVYGGLDYAILKLRIPPGGLGVPSIPLRPSLPAVGEQIFGIHHPNGAVKKLSPPHAVVERVNAWNATRIFVDTDVSGGSSGSGLFDMAGRLVGVLSSGSRCNLGYQPSPGILADIAATPTPVPGQDVMLVIDRSGSMSGDAGTGQTKIVEAREAASLFVQLIRLNAGHRVGMVSFSTSASNPVDEPLGNVDPPKKAHLIGNAPFAGGTVGAITPDGFTSIGGGIDAAQTQLPPGANARNLLILTDGLQNTPPLIDAAIADLGATRVHVIGLGTEATLDGAVLSRLAQSTGGAYTRAGDGLDLKKFFALAFGDIFTAGTLADPSFVLPDTQPTSNPFEFLVCDEQTLTVIAGWDRRGEPLRLEVTTPNGTVIGPTTPGIEQSFGRSWTFMRIPLPHVGIREGTWTAHLRRVPGAGEFPPPPETVRYFINVVVEGGPSMTVVDRGQHLYTGDDFTPQVALSYPNGTGVEDATVQLTITRPDQAAGTILSTAGLGNPVAVDGDVIPPAQATLSALAAGGGPTIAYHQETVQLRQDPALTGAFEGGPWATHIGDLLKIPGNYTFRAVGTYGHACRSTREVSWSVHVGTGIDPASTVVTTTVITTLPNGHKRIRVTFTPKDRHGNLVGPGLGPDLTVTGSPGGTPIGPVVDNGDGTYSVDIDHDPSAGHAPGITVTQPGRPSVPVSDPKAKPPLPWWFWWLILFLVILAVILAII